MKNAKLLAAVMAGTMVFASAAPVFADTQKITSVYDGWWGTYTDADGNSHTLSEEEAEPRIAVTGSFEGDGTWSMAAKCVQPATEIEGQVWVFTGDLYDANNRWVSFGSHGDCWLFGDTVQGSATGQNTSVDYGMAAGDIAVVEIVSAGGDYTISMYKNDKKLLNFKTSGVNLEGEISTRLMAQFGDFEVTNLMEGDAATALAAAQGGSSDSSASTSDESTASDDSSAGTSSDSSSNAASNSSSSDSDTTTATTTQTGDEGVIAFVVVALAGCAAIAFASKKRFVK